MRWLSALAVLIIATTAQAEDKKVATEDTVVYPLVVFPSYIRTIKNSIGSRIFRNLYYRIGDRDRDVLEGGNLSCAYFVGTILRHFGLIGEWRTSVDGLVEEMKKSGWQEVGEPVIGSVVVWEARVFRRGGEPHKHIGFYIGRGRVVSMSSKKGFPIAHGIRDGRRKIMVTLWHQKMSPRR
jgi:hypothetical protein